MLLTDTGLSEVSFVIASCGGWNSATVVAWADVIGGHKLSCSLLGNFCTGVILESSDSAKRLLWNVIL